MNKVSILIPVYNAEKYIGQCLDSLLRQTHCDFQAICVDDASTDKSREILRRYSTTDDRIETISLERNSGQAVARNMALRHATGQYITCLDADDWLAEDALEKAINTFAEHSLTDCVLFDVRFVGNGYKEHGYAWRFPKDKYQSNADGSFTSMSGHDAFILSLTWKIHGWYMLKARIFKANPFDESCRHFSDDNTTRAHFRASEEIRCCSGKYYYRQVSDSVTHTTNTSRMDYMKANASMKKTLIAWHESRQTLAIYEDERWKIIIDSYLFYFMNRSAMNASQRHFCLTEIRKYRKSIDTSLLSSRLKKKPGYITFLTSLIPEDMGWMLFRAEEEVYFTLKKLLGHI